jgi:predicted amidohydrolase YtcJ
VPADLILLPARLLDPVTGRLLRPTALAAAAGRITCLGDERRVRALAGAATTVIDLGGAVVAPGLTDGHMHPVSGAERTAGTDLSGCADLEAVRQTLARAARARLLNAGRPAP